MATIKAIMLSRITPMMIPTTLPPQPATAVAAAISIAQNHPTRGMITSPRYAGRASVESARDRQPRASPSDDRNTARRYGAAPGGSAPDDLAGSDSSALGAGGAPSTGGPARSSGGGAASADG